jgi:hypothetical protein
MIHCSCNVLLRPPTLATFVASVRFPLVSMLCRSGPSLRCLATKSGAIAYPEQHGCLTLPQPRQLRSKARFYRLTSFLCLRTRPTLTPVKTEASCLL